MQQPMQQNTMPKMSIQQILMMQQQLNLSPEQVETLLRNNTDLGSTSQPQQPYPQQSQQPYLQQPQQPQQQHNDYVSIDGVLIKKTDLKSKTTEIRPEDTKKEMTNVQNKHDGYSTVIENCNDEITDFDFNYDDALADNNIDNIVDNAFDKLSNDVTYNLDDIDEDSDHDSEEGGIVTKNVLKKKVLSEKITEKQNESETDSETDSDSDTDDETDDDTDDETDDETENNINDTKCRFASKELQLVFGNSRIKEKINKYYNTYSFRDVLSTVYNMTLEEGTDPSKCETQEIYNVDNLARWGHINLMNWIVKHTTGFVNSTSDAIDWAARCNNLHIIKWIQNVFGKHAKATEWAMDWACEGKYFDVMKWLHQNRPEGCSSMSFDYAVYHGNMEIIVWLYKHYYRYRSKEKDPRKNKHCTENGFVGAVASGNIEAFKYVLTHDKYIKKVPIEILERAFYIAAWDRKFETCKWFIETKIISEQHIKNRMAILSSIRGDLRLIKWMEEKKMVKLEDLNVNNKENKIFLAEFAGINTDMLGLPLNVGETEAETEAKVVESNPETVDVNLDSNDT